MAGQPKTANRQPLKLDEGESIQTIINVEQDRSDEAYLSLRRDEGLVKRTNVAEFQIFVRTVSKL